MFLFNSVILTSQTNGIQPFVTLYHFDLPQVLEDKYKSWLSPESVNDFAYFADICFKSFGDRVKYWITINEPWEVAMLGYRLGFPTACRCSAPFGDCTEGDSKKEPYVVAHNLILSHAAAADIYRTKYQVEQGGRIGISLMANWYEPFSNSTEDKLAVERAHTFTLKWILDPILFGEYPRDMQSILGNILPKFSNNDKDRLKAGLDFIGINHYKSVYIQDCPFSLCNQEFGFLSYDASYLEKGDIPIQQPGLEKTVTYIKDIYNNTPMFITENGYAEGSNSSYTYEQYLNDYSRIYYMALYIDSLMEAIRKGADVRGYFAWSLLDTFEFIGGYSLRYGLHYVDYGTQMRTPKLSASWYKEFIANHKTKTFVPEIKVKEKKLQLEK